MQRYYQCLQDLSKEVIEGCKPFISPHFNLTVEIPLDKAIVRGYSWTVIPISWRNRSKGVAKLKLRDMGSRYFFYYSLSLVGEIFQPGRLPEKMTLENNLTQIYVKRFSGHEKYRNRVWKVLVKEYFSKWIKSTDHILDLGCGYGEFINHVKYGVRHAMDLNPKTKSLLDNKIIFHEQDCSKPWKIDQNSLDLIFTSNFFEHLPNKESLNRTISEVKKALKPGGRLIAMGPNISVLKGKYWDFGIIMLLYLTNRFVNCFKFMTLLSSSQILNSYRTIWYE